MGRIALCSATILLTTVFVSGPVSAQDKKATTIQIDLSKLPPDLVKQLLAAQGKTAPAQRQQSGQQGKNEDDNKGGQGKGKATPAPTKGKAAPAPAKGKKQQEGEFEGENDDGDHQEGDNKQEGDQKQDGKKKKQK